MRAHSGMAQLSLEEMKDIQKPGMTKEEADMAYFEKRYQERVRWSFLRRHQYNTIDTTPVIVGRRVMWA